MATAAFGAFTMADGRDMRSEMLHAACSTQNVPCYQQTLHAWLLTTIPPTVQTPCKNSIAFQNASLCGEGSQRRY